MPVGPVLFNSRTSVVPLGNPLCIYLLVQYKLACFVLFIPLFVNTDTRHLGGLPTLLLAAMAHFLRLSSRSFPPPGSPPPITHVNHWGRLGVGAPGENLLRVALVLRRLPAVIVE